MKVLLDEDVPVPLVPIIKSLIRGHDVHHVNDVNWSGKSDVDLLKDARRQGFTLFLTNNLAQFQSPSECDAIKKSRMHHVTYTLPEDGLRGLGLASGAICAAIHPLVEELEPVRTQRIVRITGLGPARRRFTITDPSVEPPSDYW